MLTATRRFIDPRIIRAIELHGIQTQGRAHPSAAWFESDCSIKKPELMLAKISIDLEGPQAALILIGLLALSFGLYWVLRRLEQSRDRFTQLLSSESPDSNESIPLEWEIEYTNPMLLGVPQTAVRFKARKTDEGLYLWKHRSLTGATRTGVAYLPDSQYAITRENGHLNIRLRNE